MSNVVPITPNTVSLENRDIAELIRQVRWSYLNSHGSAPRFLIIGGNPWTLFKAQMKRMPGFRQGDQVMEVQGMVVVVVKRDALECGN